jgi:NAD(P)-dependent dehydrogenase (short-subunit alcohol dehydrogenase family)
MNGRLEGKVAVITGGGSGIGRASVLRFLAEGAGVVIADFNQDTGRETLELAKQAGHGARARFLRGDVAAEADVKAIVDLAVRDLGGLTTPGWRAPSVRSLTSTSRTGTTPSRFSSAASFSVASTARGR